MSRRRTEEAWEKYTKISDRSPETFLSTLYKESAILLYGCFIIYVPSADLTTLKQYMFKVPRLFSTNKPQEVS